MKPCRKNRKLIAWHILHALPKDQAARLENHLARCEGCARYRDEMSRVTQKLNSLESFGPAIDRLQVEPQASPWHPSHNSRRGVLSDRSVHSGAVQELWSRWRLAACAAAAAIFCGVLIPVIVRNNTQPARTAQQSATPPSPRLTMELSPTLANYRAIANRSLDELDDLLAKQAEKGIPTPPPLSIATLASFTD